MRQTPLGVALTGDTTRFSGPERSLVYRWFNDPSALALYAPTTQDEQSRVFVSHARALVTRRGPGSRAALLAEVLQARSAEFRELWDQHEVGLAFSEGKHFVHPQLGSLHLECQVLVDPGQGHQLLVYTAAPGSDSYEKLQLLSVIGAQPLG